MTANVPLPPQRPAEFSFAPNILPRQHVIGNFTWNGRFELYNVEDPPWVC